MNYIKHLNTVFNQFYKDDRLSAHHIALYMALFNSWNENRFENPFPVSRNELMKASKIGSLSTYSKSMWNLDHWHYIQYVPSHNPAIGTMVQLYRFDTADRTTSDTTEETTGVLLTEQLPIINIINKKENIIKGVKEIPPEKFEVELFFKNENFENVEAKKFHNYFKSNGWLIGGKTPMKDWKAAARNWMLNAEKFSKPKPDRKNDLSSNPDKDYSEPL